MASRVAIVGANGAGKSTMIKLLTGELKPTRGEIKQHPNCRFAYVAQHAFHHIEQHLDKSPNEYLCWRYEFGADKESDNKVTLDVSPEEEALMAKPVEVVTKDAEGKTVREKRVVEKLVSRRKDKKSYTYEVKWRGMRMDHNTWYARDFLERRGFKKLLMALDAQLAAAEAMMHRPLTRTNVRKHLSHVGLGTEESDHSRIRDLSGGQKVKVVLAACTWACPHLIILDEPTNYLDRDSLGALANAIDDYEGGVVLITHNKEFADATTRETWVVANNKCDVKGDPEWEKYAAEVHTTFEDEQMEVDAAGNPIAKRIPKLAEMTRAEVRERKKALRAKVKRGEEIELYEIEWAEAWKIKWDVHD
jgi:elongation factor 3